MQVPKARTQMQNLAVSQFSAVAIGDAERAMLRHWLEVTRRMVNDEDWKTSQKTACGHRLPNFGSFGTAAPEKKQTV